MQKWTRRAAIGVAGGVASVAFVGLGVAGETVDTDANDVAIQGYDAVAYFTDAKPVKGVKQLQFDWQGAHWWFSSEQHRKLFSEKPDAYAPQFGGFCAVGMINGAKITADPEAWVIVDHKLYLTENKNALGRFTADTSTSISRAEASWKHLNGQ